MNKKRKILLKNLIIKRLELDEQCIDNAIYKTYYSIELNDNDMVFIKQTYKFLKKKVEDI